jgi:hypothetical protein
VDFRYAYSKFNSGSKWSVHATPSGQLMLNEHTFSSLFWEGFLKNFIPDLRTGYIVTAESAEEFLLKMLNQIGLNESECNEFIVYWLPVLIRRRKSFVSFHIENYAKEVPMKISPEPDSILRVYMVVQDPNAVDESTLEGQTFSRFERKGFTVIEWGGGEWKNQE